MLCRVGFQFCRLPCLASRLFAAQRSANCSSLILSCMKPVSTQASARITPFTGTRLRKLSVGPTTQRPA